MCKHVPFDRNSWAPCAVCVKEKRAASTLKNESALRAEMAGYLADAEYAEARGRNASAASYRQDAEMIRVRLIAAGLPA